MQTLCDYGKPQGVSSFLASADRMGSSHKLNTHKEGASANANAWQLNLSAYSLARSLMCGALNCYESSAHVI
jgi:hypothetical protein